MSHDRRTVSIHDQLTACQERVTCLAMAALGSERTNNQGDGEALYRGIDDLGTALARVRDDFDAYAKQGGAA